MMDCQMAMSGGLAVGVERKERSVRDVCVQTVHLGLYSTLKQTESMKKWPRSNQLFQE